MKLLEVRPENSITFQGSFKEVTSQKISLTNISEKTVAFKIKTTAPKQYCVRPSVGFIDSNESKEISIMLQPLQNGPTEKAKHKFQVQSLMVENRDSSKLDSLWKTCSPEEICVAKLVCALEYIPDKGDVADHERDNEKDESLTLINGKDSSLSISEDRDLDSSLIEDSLTMTPKSIDNFVTPISKVTTTDSATQLNELPITPDPDVIANQTRIISELNCENDSLKDEICNLKSTIFSYCHRIEILQADNVIKTHSVQSPSGSDETTGTTMRTTRADSNDSEGTKVDSSLQNINMWQPNRGFTSSTSQSFIENSTNIQDSSSTNPNVFSILGLPLIVYFLLAFFIGLIIGKFLL